MTDFIFKVSSKASLPALYKEMKIEKTVVREICRSPLRAQALLMRQATLGALGTLSFYPLGEERIILCVRSKSYADAHACAQAIEKLLCEAQT